MIQKIKENLNKIIVIIGFCGLFFIGNAFLSIDFDAALTSGTIILMISYGLYAASMILFIINCKNEVQINNIKLPFTLFVSYFISIRLTTINTLTISQVPYILLYATILIMFLLSYTEESIKTILKVLLVIFSIVTVSRMLGGSAIDIVNIVIILTVSYLLFWKEI